MASFVLLPVVALGDRRVLVQPFLVVAGVVVATTLPEISTNQVILKGNAAIKALESTRSRCHSQ